MKKVKPIEFVFYSVITPDIAGLKLVLWKITDTDNVSTYDWGFAYWDGKAWEEIEVPAGYTAEVKWWSNTVSPDLLLKEPSKIIRLN